MQIEVSNITEHMRHATDAEHRKISRYVKTREVYGAWQLRQIMPLAALLAIVTCFVAITRRDAYSAMLSAVLLLLAVYAYARVNAAGNKIARFERREYLVCEGHLQEDEGAEGTEMFYADKGGFLVPLDVIAGTSADIRPTQGMPLLMVVEEREVDQDKIRNYFFVQTP